MKTVEALAALDTYQASILATVEATVPLLGGEPVAVCPVLARARWTLARQLRAYQVFKHSEIFEPAMRTGGPAHAARARAMAARCIAAGEAFEAYLKRWSGRDVAGCWHEYRPAMQAMTDRIRATLAAEREGVAALLAGSDRTRQLSG